MDKVENLNIAWTPRERVPFGAYDLGWVVLCIGMAIGSGIVFMPVQMGLKGFWVSVTALLIAYPAVHYMAKLYLRSLSASDDCSDYSRIMATYVGSNWAALLSIAYFLMLAKGMLTYASTITRDSSSYLQTFGVSEHPLADTLWFPLLVIAVLVGLASQGERLLFRISGPLIAIKLSIVVFLGLSMIPYWNLKHIDFNIGGGRLDFVRDVLLTLPFAMFSILFVQILNPMNVAFRKEEADPRLATYRALRASRVAFVVLVVCVLFFAFSFLLSISHADAEYALAHNISALALAAKTMHGDTVRALSTTLNVVAIFTAFFGIYLGFQDAVTGIINNLLDRVMTRSPAFDRHLPKLVALLSIAALTSWVVLDISAMALIQWTVPIFGLVSCLVPCYLVCKVPALRQFKTWDVAFIALFGLLLIVSPLFKLLE